MKTLLTLFLISGSVHAGTIPFSVRMDKLSLHARGKPLSYLEKKEIAAVPVLDRETYFRARLKEYLDSNTGADAFIHWQLERFKMRTKVLGQDFGGNVVEDNFSAYLRRTYSENRSWDELLNGREYVMKSTNQVGVIPENDFFALVMPGLDRSGNILQRIGTPTDGNNSSPSENGLNQAPRPDFYLRFAPGDNRIAGLLTTPRFAARFTTTDVNKNRRRAAQVYRIFLCDPMFPAIPEDPGKKSKFLEHVFKQHSPVEMKDADIQLSTETAHGQSPVCMGCHSKLDPMGRTFQKMVKVLHKDPSGGTLVLRRKAGDLIQKVSGIGELADTIVRQPEYVSCQVKTFWKQYIGKDVPLSEKTEAELVREFERVGRRTKDFVEVLLRRPEFATEPSKELEVRYTAVRDLLKRCDSCHEGALLPYNAEALPFDQLYWNKDVEKITAWLLKVKGRIHLPASDPGKMPQNWVSWSDSDLAQVKRWIDKGAQDDDGKKWLEAE